jgi:hypothetical protein
MKIIQIKSNKQDNGIWGMPLNCIKIGNFKLYNERLILLTSSLIIAIDEKFNRKFEVWYDSEFLSVRMLNEYIDEYTFRPGKIYTVYFKNYEIIDNTLYEFDNEKEKTMFLRTQKLNKLKNVNSDNYSNNSIY